MHIGKISVLRIETPPTHFQILDNYLSLDPISAESEKAKP
jgi:hypothetical protein